MSNIIIIKQLLFREVYQEVLGMRGETMRCPICNKYTPPKGEVLCSGCYEAPLLVSSEIKGDNKMKLTRNNYDACTRMNRTVAPEVVA